MRNCTALSATIPFIISLCTLITLSTKSNTILNTPGKIVQFTKKCVWAVEEEDGKEINITTIRVSTVM